MEMTSIIKNKRIIVTGGARGLGYEFCEHFLRKEAKGLVILDCDETQGHRSVVELNEKYDGNKAVLIVVDVSKADKLKEGFKKAVKILGGVDIVINNAGIFNDAEWSLAIDVNLKGTIQGSLLAIEVMGKHNGGDGGVVVNVASVAGLLPGMKIMPVYCATKHAIVAFSESIADSFDKTGVSVKVICPHATDTGILASVSNRIFDFISNDESAQYFRSMKLQKPTSVLFCGHLFTGKYRSLNSSISATTSKYVRYNNNWYFRSEIVAEALVRLIEEAPNSAVWLQAHGNPPLRVIFPGLESLVAPVPEK